MLLVSTKGIRNPEDPLRFEQGNAIGKLKPFFFFTKSNYNEKFEAFVLSIIKGQNPVNNNNKKTLVLKF